MHELEKEFSIDITRRYVIGESLGGYGTWHFITTRPQMFAAAVPVCGVGDPALADRRECSCLGLMDGMTETFPCEVQPI